MKPEKVSYVERYKNPVFEKIAVTKDIQYGTVSGYYASKPIDYISNDDYKQVLDEMRDTYIANNAFVSQKKQIELPLKLDIYRPENDNLEKTPLFLFLHGGAFFFGDKENTMQKFITNFLVKRGYTVASVNYRLGSSLLGKGAIERAIYRDVQDARAALRYLVANKSRFGIDENQIYLAGSSAGGIIALTTTFMDDNEVYNSTGAGLFKEDLGGLDDSGNSIKAEFNIAGVVSLWGGVTDLKILNNPVPTLLFHGKDDDIIPCDKGLPFKNNLKQTVIGSLVHDIGTFLIGQLYGSKSVCNHLNNNNISAKYIPFPNCGHELCIDADGTVNSKMNIICDETGIFLYENVSRQYFNYQLSGNIRVGKYDPAPKYKLSNVKNASVQWHIEGGFITSQTNEEIRVIWYSDNQGGKITACITNENGVSCKKELSVIIL
jgi:predicted esterase